MDSSNHTSLHEDTSVEPAPIVSGDVASSILEDHGDQPLEPRESARIWSHAALKGVELFQGSYRKYEFAPHFHSVPAIGVVDQGAMRCDYRSSAEHVSAGGIITLNPGDVHAPGPICEQGWSFRVFFLDNTIFEARSLDVAEQVLRFPKQSIEAPRLAQSLLRLHRNLEGQRNTLEAESELLNIFEQLAEISGVAPWGLAQSRAEKGLVRRVRDYIDAYYRRNISLTELSGAVGTSPFHLLRTFRAEVGLTPHAYQIQVRIEAAKRLLRSRTAIAEVASRTGFTDQSHFTRRFKRLTGVTPSRYRP